MTKKWKWRFRPSCTAEKKQTCGYITIDRSKDIKVKYRVSTSGWYWGEVCTEGQIPSVLQPFTILLTVCLQNGMSIKWSELFKFTFIMFYHVSLLFWRRKGCGVYENTYNKPKKWQLRMQVKLACAHQHSCWTCTIWPLPLWSNWGNAPWTL